MQKGQNLARRIFLKQSLSTKNIFQLPNSIQMLRSISIFLLLGLMMSSCLVSKKKFEALQTKEQAAIQEQKILQTKLDQCQSEKAAALKLQEETALALKKSENEVLVAETLLQNAKGQLNEQKQQLDYYQQNNTDLLARLSDLAVLNKAGTESVKKSLEALSEQNRYVRDLTSSLRRKDSLNLVLVMNLKRSLDNINDEDIQIEVKKGVVYISLSDKLLFKSGSYDINLKAEDVLAKIAKVVKDHKELDILVEGHTDNVPIKNDCMKDNWDLSVMRATAVVRLLQEKHEVTPSRMTAGGRSEYVPKTSNENFDGRASNRRTEIIITPKLDQFFQLLTPPGQED
jgi:chemotaxis protein MotB